MTNDKLRKLQANFDAKGWNETADADAAADGSTMPTAITPGLYRHFKGATYEVLCVGTIHDTGRKYVAYFQLGHDHVWLRELEEFAGTVTNDGKETKRFERVDCGEND